MIVFNEPLLEFDEILDIAKRDSDHSLHKNYQNINVDDFLFVTLFIMDGKPANFYGLQQKPWMGESAARAYTRAYKTPEFRQQHYHRSFIDVISKGGYDHIENWWRSMGIDTLFVTRNVADKADGFMTLFKRYSIGKWNQYPYVCNINNVDQYVMWMGDPKLDFLQPLHSYQLNE